MTNVMKMKAPRRCKSATIEGHTYEDIPHDGVITLVSSTHRNTLLRHGFVDHFDPADAAAEVDGMDDADDLVEFIEERGGEADNTWSIKKLRRVAHELLASANTPEG